MLSFNGVTGWFILQMEPEQRFRGWQIFADKPQHPNAIEVVVLPKELYEKQINEKI